MPVLALGIAALWQRIDSAPILVAAAWTVALVVHGMAYPWRLFHIQNGENFAGENDHQFERQIAPDLSERAVPGFGRNDGVENQLSNPESRDWHD